MSEYQSIDIDPPSSKQSNPILSHSEFPQKRRRINSPSQAARSATIDPALARVLWNHQPISHPHRRRRSSQNLGESPPVRKRARTSGPKSSHAPKRPTSPDFPSPALHHVQSQNKRQKLNIFPPISTRSKTVLPPFPKLPLSRLKKPTGSSSHASSSNFIPSAEARTKYAQNVAEAEKHREEGNRLYNRKQYQLAIKSYTQALESYPRQPLPDEPYHPGYSTSLANLGSAYMALSEFQLAAHQLQKSLESVELTPLLPRDTRNILIKRLFRLIRCHIASLNSQAASTTLKLVQDPQSPVHITPNDSSFNEEFSSLLLKSNFLFQAEIQVGQARSNFHWKNVLEIVNNTQVEVLSWGFNLKPNLLPGFWPIWKAEALARLGNPLEAERTVFHLKDTGPLASELKMVRVLICLASGNLDEADSKLTEILSQEPVERDARLLSVHLKGLMTQLAKIEDTSLQFGSTDIISKCQKILHTLTDPITFTLRLQVHTIMCEQLSDYYIRNPNIEINLPWKIVHLSDMMLEFFGLSSIKEQKTTNPIHRLYVIRILIARARATLRATPRISESSYALLFELLDQTWPDLKIHNRSSILAEIEARIGVSSRHHRPNFSHSDPHSLPSHRRSWDPKGYYQILEVRRDASTSEIKKSFRKLSLKYHPDKGGKTESFQAINIAYEVLSDRDSRNSYDLLSS